METSCETEYVAIVPAAGVGSRLPDRKLSKELVTFADASGEPRPVISHLLDCLVGAGVNDIIVVTRTDKRDIGEYLAQPEWQSCNFDLVITDGTSGVPETVALGLDRSAGRRVVFGFPDILFRPNDAISTLIGALDNSRADVMLGLFPTNNPSKMDMVATDETGQVLDIVIKSKTTRLPMTWILAVWSAEFSHYLSTLFVDSPGRLRRQTRGAGGGHLGHAFQLALADGILIESVSFAEGACLDIGTPDDLARAAHWTG